MAPPCRMHQTVTCTTPKECMVTSALASSFFFDPSLASLAHHAVFAAPGPALQPAPNWHNLAAVHLVAQLASWSVHAVEPVLRSAERLLHTYHLARSLPA